MRWLGYRVLPHCSQKEKLFFRMWNSGILALLINCSRINEVLWLLLMMKRETVFFTADIQTLTLFWDDKAGDHIPAFLNCESYEYFMTFHELKWSFSRKSVPRCSLEMVVGKIHKRLCFIYLWGSSYQKVLIQN